MKMATEKGSGKLSQRLKKARPVRHSTEELPSQVVGTFSMEAVLETGGSDSEGIVYI